MCVDANEYQVQIKKILIVGCHRPHIAVAARNSQQPSIIGKLNAVSELKRGADGGPNVANVSSRDAGVRQTSLQGN